MPNSKTVNVFRPNKMEKDYYKLLEIPMDSSTEQIRRAFRKLAKKYHPDVNRSDKDCEEKFKKILEGYEILTNSKSRAAYDRQIKGEFSNNNEPDNFYNPLEPKYKTFQDILLILENVTSELTKLKPSSVNINALFTILNNILNPDIIINQINTSRKAERKYFIERIIFCYDYLPSHSIKHLQYKLALLYTADTNYKKEVKRILYRKKMIEGIKLFWEHSYPINFLIFVFILVLIIAFISWLVGLL